MTENTAYTAEGALWITEGGLISCRDHGGSYLQAAIRAGEGPHIVTPLDDWLYHSPETVAQYDFECETCQHNRPETIEVTFTDEQEAHTEYARYGDRAASLLAFDPNRNLYAFDIYTH